MAGSFLGLRPRSGDVGQVLVSEAGAGLVEVADAVALLTALGDDCDRVEGLPRGIADDAVDLIDRMGTRGA